MKKDPVVSIDGYVVDASEMRDIIQRIEKELSETREALYGKQNATSLKEVTHGDCC